MLLLLFHLLIFFTSIDQSELKVTDEELTLKVYPYPYKYEHKHDILPVLRNPYRDMIECTLVNDNTCKLTVKSEGKRTVVKWEGCKANVSNIILAIAKTQPFKLASLECRQANGNLIDIILADGKIRYPPGIACDKDHSECIGDHIQCYNEPEPQYCLVKQNKSGEKPVVQKCVNFPLEDECARWTWKQPDRRYCPVDVIGRCKATAKNRTRTWFSVDRSIPCPEGEYGFPLWHKNKPVLYSDIFAIKQHDSIVFECEGRPFYMHMVEQTRGRTYNEPDEVETAKWLCNQSLVIPYETDPFFKEGTRLVEVALWTNYTYKDTSGKMRNATALFEYEMVIFSNFSIVANATRLTRHHSNLSCELTITNPSDFIITKSLWWTNRTGNDAGHAREPRPLPNSGSYQCHVELEYRMCAPYQKFTAVLSSNTVEADVDDVRSLAGATNPEWETFIYAISFLFALQELALGFQGYPPS